MATYYIRKTGSDANAGTSAGAAWLTLGKLLGATGFASGDTAYVGAGVYRAVITVNMSNPVADTKVIGDVTGQFTGDAGEVQLTGYLTGDIGSPSATSLLNLNGRNFLTFQDLVMVSNAATINAGTPTSSNINLIRCNIQTTSVSNVVVINITPAANVALNWVIDSCVIMGGIGSPLTITPVRPAGADFDLNFIIKNSFINFPTSGTWLGLAAPTGANTFNPGGVRVYNCTILSSGTIRITGANWSTSIPATQYNCFHYGAGGAVVAGAAGQIVEDYNIYMTGGSPRTNVTAGAHSISDGSYAPLFFVGSEYSSVGANLMPFAMPKPGSPLSGFGNQAATVTIDMLGITRPAGFVKLATGTATSGAAKTITLSTATYGTNSFAGSSIKIISGTGSGQTKSIASNTATVITVDGNWKTNPDSTSVFEVYLRAASSTGTFTAGSTTTGTDANAAWGVNMWAGYTITTDSGTGSGQTLIVISNTATVLTWAAATAVDNTTTYSLFRGTNVNAINAGVGCYENGQSAIKETGTVRTGSNSIRIPGAGYYDFAIPVNAVSATITIYAQYDSAYSGTLPSISIINGTECGVANATNTLVGSANTWVQLTLTIVPTSQGIVTLRCLSSSTTPTGNAFFDDYNIV